MNIINKNIKGYSKKWILHLFIPLLSFFAATPLFAQNIGISDSGATPSKYAVLDLSTATRRGVLLPTMTTTQRNALSPPSGTLIFNSTTNCLETYYTVTSSWQTIVCPCSGAPGSPVITGSNSITALSTGNVYSISAVAGATSYSWTVPTQVGTLVSGQGTTSITVTAAVLAETTYSISCTATNSCGSTTTNYAVTVTSTCAHGSQVFTYTGSNQTWAVPTCITTCTVQCWGAGGGGGSYDPGYYNSGGSGGYVSGTLNVTTYEGTNLTIIVGQGGVVFGTSTSYGGGGAVSNSNYYASSGGGMSAITSGGTYLVVAGGAGGAGDAVYNTGGSVTNGVGYGGAGGGSTGGASNASYEVGSAGGGTQAAGGAGGVGNSQTGYAGAAYTGGAGRSSSYDAAGGGGGGYYGGGGGGYSGGGYGAGGGGGGSSYTTNGKFTNFGASVASYTPAGYGAGGLQGNTNATGVGTTAVATTMSNYVSGVGEGGCGGCGGGNAAQNGGNGLVVIIW